MTIRLTQIKPSTRLNKKYMAEFSTGDTVHFGQFLSATYLDHNNDKIKEAYLKRHKPNEDWNNPYTPGSLSRFILWNKPTLKESIEDYKQRFNL